MTVNLDFRPLSTGRHLAFDDDMQTLAAWRYLSVTVKGVVYFCLLLVYLLVFCCIQVDESKRVVLRKDEADSIVTHVFYGGNRHVVRRPSKRFLYAG